MVRTINVKVKIDSPVLSTQDFAKISNLMNDRYRATTLSTVYDLVKPSQNRFATCFGKSVQIC